MARAERERIPLRSGARPSLIRANPLSWPTTSWRTRSPMYTTLEHYIDGSWVKPSGEKSQDVINPATSKPIGQLGHVSRGDLDKALAAADKGFKHWRKVSSFERGRILR